ncbi:MAG: PIN domain-containing protein [Chloroflexota bacterium]|nr:PIN domain-containing protein [Chloroflexota bacterium]
MNDIVFLDTNIVSYLFNRDTRAMLYRPYLVNNTTYLSFMTVAEMHFGADRARWGDSGRHRLSVFLRGYPVVQSTPEICVLWGQITAACEHQGRRIVAADAWIAACALRYDAPLITHNRKDFDAVPDLQIISEND